MRVLLDLGWLLDRLVGDHCLVLCGGLRAIGVLPLAGVDHLDGLDWLLELDGLRAFCDSWKWMRIVIRISGIFGMLGIIRFSRVSGLGAVRFFELVGNSLVWVVVSDWESNVVVEKLWPGHPLLWIRLKKFSDEHLGALWNPVDKGGEVVLTAIDLHFEIWERVGLIWSSAVEEFVQQNA